MNKSGNRSARGVYAQETLTVIVLVAILYYGYQYISIYKAPNILLNKNYVAEDDCIGGGVVGSNWLRRRRNWVHCLACQNPKLLAEQARQTSLLSHLQAPDKAVQNDLDRTEFMRIHYSEFVNLASKAKYDPDSENYTPLMVHVLAADNSEKDVPLLKVQALNKVHKGGSGI